MSAIFSLSVEKIKKDHLYSQKDYKAALNKIDTYVVPEFAKINAFFIPIGGQNAYNKHLELYQFRNIKMENEMDVGGIGLYRYLGFMNNPNKRIIVKCHYIENGIFTDKPNINVSGAQMKKLYDNNESKIIPALYNKYTLSNIHFLLFSKFSFMLIPFKEIPIKSFTMRSRYGRNFDRLAVRNFKPKMRPFTELKTTLEKCLNNDTESNNTKFSESQILQTRIFQWYEYYNRCDR